MSRIIALGILLASCATRPALLPHEEVAGRAVAKAWAEKGLPPPTRRARCAVEDYQVAVTTTSAEWKHWCPTSDPSHNAGCLGWSTTGNWFLWHTYPVVVVSPIHYTESTIVVHELLHAYVQCSELHPDPWNPGDREHSDPRVWSAAGDDTSAQTRANALSEEIERD